jgi:hypothetical protein
LTPTAPGSHWGRKSERLNHHGSNRFIIQKKVLFRTFFLKVSNNMLPAAAEPGNS